MPFKIQKFTTPHHHIITSPRLYQFTIHQFTLTSRISHLGSQISHLHIITSSHHHIITSSHHHIITSPLLYDFTNSRFTNSLSHLESRILHLGSHISHLHIITSPHHHITTSSHHHIITSSHLTS